MTTTDIKFAYLIESTKGSNGKTTWTSAGTSSAINIEDVSVTTSAEYISTEFGVTPKIIPLGCKNRVASITGTFKGRSLTDQDSEYLDVLQDAVDIRGRGIKVVSGYNEFPELGNGIPWQIASFSWDRQAKLRGQWKFMMNLVYIWNSSINEIQLYADGVGSNIPTDIRFSATIGISNSGYSSSYLINNVKIHADIQSINTASFSTITSTYTKGDIIHIYCSTDEGNAVFFGIVNEVKSGNKIVNYDCIEIGDLMSRVAVSKSTSGLFKPKVMIKNKLDDGKTKRPLSSFISTILKFYSINPVSSFNNFGVGVDKTGYGNSTDIPGHKGVQIPTQMLSVMSVFKALNRVVEDQCGLRTWYHNNTGALEYGYWRNVYNIDVTKDIIIANEQTYGYSEDFKPNNVIVVDNSGRPSCYPATPVAGTTLKYQYTSDMNDNMIGTLAMQIYTDLNIDDRSVYKVKFPPGCIKMREGDKFSGLGDQTITPVMIWRDGSDDDPLVDPTDTSWQIKELTITETYTEVVVGPSYFSVFDLYKDAIKKISEAPVQTDTKSVYTSTAVVK
jgi:hypothetical protein